MHDVNDNDESYDSSIDISALLAYSIGTLYISTEHKDDSLFEDTFKYIAIPDGLLGIDIVQFIKRLDDD